MEALAPGTPAADTYESPNSFSPKCWMECMKKPNDYESRLWKILEEEKLAALSQFHQQGFFDEVPLYSRESEIDFLPAGKDAASEILLTFALRFLNAVIAYEEHRAGYFAAITVRSVPPAPLIPNLFVWSGPIRDLEDKLALGSVKTTFGKRIKSLVRRLRFREPFEVLEDISTEPDTPRVFIAPARPPYPSFAVLDRFRRSASASSRRRLRA
jgi:hypothetical protein